MFPPVESADDDGVVAIGGDLHPEMLREAYRNGIFPWPVEDLPLLWFAPPRRALLFLDEFHISRRLARQLRSEPFEIRFDTNFAAVIRACAAARVDAEGTWITDDMIEAYIRLHELGEAHSVEAWRDGELAGGLYGVSWRGYFAGESMFHHATGASKAALVGLVERLRERDCPWIDVQMMTPIFASFGAREVSRTEFMGLLREALEEKAVF